MQPLTPDCLVGRKADKPFTRVSVRELRNFRQLPYAVRSRTRYAGSHPRPSVNRVCVTLVPFLPPTSCPLRCSKRGRLEPRACSFSDAAKPEYLADHDGCFRRLGSLVDELLRQRTQLHERDIRMISHL